MPDARGADWVSLITHLSHDDPEQLMASPLNWRIHEKAQQDIMESVLDEVGWAGAVIVNDQTGNVLDGHMRVSLALKHGASSIPVLHLNVSEEKEKLILATYDPIGALAAADKTKFKELTADMQQPQTAALRNMLQDMSLRYRDGEVGESFRAFIENQETPDDDDDDDATDDDEDDDGEDEQFYPVTYSLTKDQRTVIQGAIKKARSMQSFTTSAEALEYICHKYLEGDIS